MRTIKLHFTDPNHLTTLLNDPAFSADIAYLNPERLDNHNLQLVEPVPDHDPLDSEEVVLSKFAEGIKTILFPTTPYSIGFLNAFDGQQKGGLHHNNYRIIDSTDIEHFTIRVEALEN